MSRGCPVADIDDYLEQMIEEINDGKAYLRHLRANTARTAPAEERDKVNEAADDVDHLVRVYSLAKLRYEAAIAEALIGRRIMVAIRHDPKTDAIRRRLTERREAMPERTDPDAE